MGLMVDESIEIQNLIRENQRLQAVIDEQAERFESVIKELAEEIRAALNANQK